MSRLHNTINSEELKQQRIDEEKPRVTLSFYVYAHIEDPQSFRNDLYRHFQALDVLGRIYVAAEGVNAQVNVPEDNFESFKNHLNSTEVFKGIRLNIAVEKDAFSFYKLIVKVRKKIVADGLYDEDFDVRDGATHIDARTFNELADQEDTIIVDMRNHYESEVGHFEGAVIPDVETFRESLPVVEAILSGKEDHPILMYCTGGIRCEKAGAWFKHKGYKQVYQLEGGIIEYARQSAHLGLENKFKGKNFVFDERMGERISDDIIARCHQCGEPCDTHVNCANDACHILFIQCPQCSDQYEQCCSKKCADFMKLPVEERARLKGTITFNGSQFGKGRYNPNRALGNLTL